ncbi:L30e-like protein [Sodiomyces alkalinus F11]|uniref:H/ACA ribonucleoprotein complex subunit 2 n=1 Tax=Sodiomyces alkalinus (strain CBS 110278 / VKM F-3762 / F11) TaxID=1314773 RepID=A0A3N2Q420_SODAK|nr:L30e-like protein [Sodiomyces alkalinus F11]ROT41502.1 L30e-like protein [Sodiomyces alkalinus F11]
MASERPDKKEKKDKKDKKEKKEKRSEADGIHKPKKDKKDKKEKKEKLERALEGHLQADAVAAAAAPVVVSDGAVKKVSPIVPGALVPFAVPLADDKAMKKVLKTVRKAAKNNTLKRGVKEVVKTLRKSPPAAPGRTTFPGVLIIAGDISPQDVVSHLPVLCEDHNVPYIFVPSRAELGAAAKTKRPTSVVMVMETGSAKKAGEKKKDDAKDDGEDDGETFKDAYDSLVKLVQKETARQSFWA